MIVNFLGNTFHSQTTDKTSFLWICSQGFKTVKGMVGKSAVERLFCFTLIGSMSLSQGCWWFSDLWGQPLAVEWGQLLWHSSCDESSTLITWFVEGGFKLLSKLFLLSHTSTSVTAHQLTSTTLRWHNHNSNSNYSYNDAHNSNNEW